MCMRDSKIDFIRALCSMTVILAHVSAPAWINDIRTFDVVVLVMLSGMSLMYASRTSYSRYLWKRIQKLVLPTLLMMALVFSGSYIVCSVLGINQLYSGNQILRSFMLLNEGSMGYVWIVRVYFMVAILTPIIRFAEERTTKLTSMLLINIVGFFAADLLLLSSGILPDSLLRTVLLDWGHSSLVYALIAYDGLWIIQNRNKSNVIIGVCACVFLFCTIIISIPAHQLIFDPSSYKFPPQVYYCSYGVLVGILLYRIAPNREMYIVRWLSSRSFSIYLWHIVMLHAYGVIVKLPFINVIDSIWWLKYVIVVALSVIATIIFESITKRFKKVTK